MHTCIYTTNVQCTCVHVHNYLPCSCTYLHDVHFVYQSVGLFVLLAAITIAVGQIHVSGCVAKSYTSHTITSFTIASSHSPPLCSAPLPSPPLPSPPPSLPSLLQSLLGLSHNVRRRFYFTVYDLFHYITEAK